MTAFSFPRRIVPGVWQSFKELKVVLSKLWRIARLVALGLAAALAASEPARAASSYNIQVSPGSPASGNFTIAAIGPNSSKTFFIGGDLGVAGDDSGLGTGDSEADFSVLFAESPTVPTTGTTGRAKVRVIRSITVAKISDMIFGTVVKPAVGPGSVTLNALSGVRTVTGGSGIGAPVPTLAQVTVGGEGGQTFTLTVPPTFQMTGPGTPLTVTTNNSGSPTPTLSAALGAQGSYNFAVGGTFPISATMVSGDYAGTLTVTVAYN